LSSLANPTLDEFHHVSIPWAAGPKLPREVPKLGQRVAGSTLKTVDTLEQDGVSRQPGAELVQL
jgi:hypothetical protein